MLTLIICDDEPLARERLRRMVEKLPTIQIVAEAGNGRELLDAVAQHQPDVVMTDIRMPGMDGLEAAQHLAELGSPPAIVFCTAYDEYALQALQVQAIGYLVKPVRLDELSQVLAKATRVNRAQLSAVRERLGEQELPGTGLQGRQFISARSHRGIELVPVDQVRYFMADQKYVTVRYPEGEVIIDHTLKELEDEFGDRFLRVHRNALVAVAFIDGIEQGGGHTQLRIQGVSERVAVSRRHAAVVRKRLTDMVLK